MADALHYPHGFIPRGLYQCQARSKLLPADPKRGYLCIAVAHFRDLDRHLRNQNDPASPAIEIRRTSVGINDYTSDSRAPASPWGAG